MSTPSIEVFDEAQVRALLPMPRVISAMEKAFSVISAGAAQLPVRTGIALEDPDARLLVMPASVPGWPYASVKIVCVVPQNRNRGIETINGVIDVFDARTGVPCARVHAESVTALRTGAASGLATRLLAPPEADVLALFGAGIQAATQLEAIHCVRPLREVLVFGREPERSAAFCRHWSTALGIPVRTAQREELGAATIVATATTSTEPLFALDELHPEAHVNAVGTFTPEASELPPELLAKARVVVDQRVACLQEAGEFHRARAAGLLDGHEHPEELGEVLLASDSADPARRNTRADQQAAGMARSRGRTVFKSVGNALQDLACVCALMEARHTP